MKDDTKREIYYGDIGYINRPNRHMVFFDGTIYYRAYYETRNYGPDHIGSSGNRTWPDLENNIARGTDRFPTSDLYIK